MPRFSLLIATVGRPALVQTAIASIVEQPWTDWEIIVTDCKKGDGVEDLVRSLNDPRIRYMVTPEQDPSLGWDAAYTASTGEYVLWFDDDNLLLPQTLSLCDRLIRETSAEVITGSHLYYYNETYQRWDRRHALGVVPFDGHQESLEPSAVATALLGFRTIGSPIPFRFHPAATFYARTLCERIRARVGFTVLPKMKVNHSVQLLLLPFANRIEAISLPFAIVGRLHISLTQAFATLGEAKKRSVQVFTESPVTGDIYRNHIFEALLRVRALFPKELGSIAPDITRFFSLYLRDLFFYETDAPTARKNWGEAGRVIRALPDAAARQRLLVTYRALRLRACIAQPIKSIGAWRPLKNALRSLVIFFGKEKSHTWGASSEFIIPLACFHISHMGELPAQAGAIVAAACGKDILTGKNVAVA